jgi:hypothetical protein
MSKHNPPQPKGLTVSLLLTEKQPTKEDLQAPPKKSRILPYLSPIYLFICLYHLLLKTKENKEKKRK